ncbi:hypothetical protein QYE76_033251 [Lolium multiflorum]|uniref:Uncharacterized protein n=1 Tax=Lolium multiflorum TaxID=4521 RepID=A0AAD8QV38_LOLMU|nr:hypothetical protein QYE76_033251 [Lolium multiflorum]
MKNKSRPAQHPVGPAATPAHPVTSPVQPDATQDAPWRQPDDTLTPTERVTAEQFPRPVSTRRQVRFEPACPVPGPVDRPPDRPSPCLDAKLVNQKDKDAADLITWRDFEALRNEMRREFRIEDDGLKGEVQEINQKLDATNETVTAMADQMTDIQRSLRTLTMSVENLTNQQQQQDEDADDALGRGDRPRGCVHLAALVVDLMMKMDWESPSFPYPSLKEELTLKNTSLGSLRLRSYGAYIRITLKIGRSSLLLPNLMAMHSVGGMHLFVIDKQMVSHLLSHGVL